MNRGARELSRGVGGVGRVAALVLGIAPAVWAQVAAPLIPGTQNTPLNNSSPAFADLNSDGKLDLIYVSAGQSLSGPSPLTIIPCEVIETRASLDKKSSPSKRGAEAPLPLDPEPPPPDAGMWVHALDGATNYTTELPTAWPRQIASSGGCNAGKHPTVALNVMPSTNFLTVAVGGDFGGNQVFAFKPDGTDLAGFPTTSQDGPFYNPFVEEDANNDGAVDVVGADESCYMQRWNGVGTRRQCQWVANFVYSGPAVGDVGILNSQQADGIRDEVGAGQAPPFLVRTYDSFGKSQACTTEPPPDLFFDRGNGSYTSSSALAHLDADAAPRTQDIAIVNGTTNTLQVFSSLDGLQEYTLPSPVTPKIGLPGYSSPTVADLDGGGVYDTILAGADSGHLVALRYRPNDTPRLALRWQTLLDSGYSISSSPVVAKLLPGTRPQIVVGTDKGNVYMLDGDGNILSPYYTLLNGQPVDDTAATWGTPVVWTRRVDTTGETCVADGAEATNCPVIVAGNRRGLFKIVLTGQPPFDPAVAQWPTFRRSNTRTGALDPSQDNSQAPIPTRGSIGGVAGPTCTASDVRLLDANGDPVNDYYTGLPAQETPRSDGRFLFELLLPGDYKVRFNNDSAFDLDVTVTAGALASADRPSCP